MNKFITKLAKLFLGISMAAGVGVAVGTNSKRAEGVSASSKTLTFSTTSGTDGIWSWSTSKGSGSTNPTVNNGLRLYQKNTMTISTSSATVSQIDSISYTFKINKSSGKYPAAPSSSDGTVSYSGSWNGSNTNFVITCTATGKKSVTFTVGNNAGNLAFSSAEVTYTEASTSTTLDGVSGITATVTARQGAQSWNVSNVSVTGTLNSVPNSNVTSYVDITPITAVPSTVENPYTVQFDIEKKDGVDGDFVSGTYSVTNAYTTPDPFISFEKVSSTSDMETTDVYAFGNSEKTYFAGNSIASKGLTVKDDTTDLGYFCFDAEGHLAFCTLTNNVWSASTSEYLNSKNGETELTIGTSSTTWSGSDDTDGVLIIATSNADRYLGFTTNTISTSAGIKGYASSSSHATYPPLYLYKVGELAGIKYTVTYDANNNSATGTTTDQNSPYDKGDDATIVANGFSLVGHTFVEWNTKADGSGDSYDANDVIEDIQSNIVLYAQWQEIDYVAVKQASVTVPLSGTYDLTSNLITYGSGAISYSPASTNYYTISGNTLTPIAETESALTIQVSKVGVQTSVSFEINIVDAHAGTEDDPFTVAEALSMAATAGSSGTTTGYYVAGYIVGDPTFGSNRGRAYLGDSPTSEQSDCIYAYGFNGFDNKADLSTGCIVEGDWIVVTGSIFDYSGVAEIGYKNNVNCYLAGIDPVDPAVVTIDVAEKALFVGESYQFTITESTRDYLDSGITYSFKDNTIGSDYTWTENTKTFVAGQTKGQITLVATSNFDENAYAECIITISKKLVPPSGGDGQFEKITSTSDLESGSYLIVYETGGVAFDGSLTTLDAVGNTIDVTITDNVIEATETNLASIFQYDADASTLQSASGYYIGKTATGNGLNSSTTEAYTNSISFESGNAVITSSGGPILRYNDASNQTRFRYYGSGQKAIQLYKYVEGSSVESNLVYFCQQILDFLECDDTGTNSPSTSEWGQLKTLYLQDGFLTAEEKQTLLNTTAASYDSRIPSDPTDNDYLIYSLSKYDYVIAKYGHLEDGNGIKIYANFIGRAVTPINGSRLNLSTIMGENTNTIAIIVIISMVSMTAIGGYFFLRKRKENI